MRVHVLVLPVILALSAHCAQATANIAALPEPSDLQREAGSAASDGKPVVILISMPGCTFCHVVRSNYLLPLVRASAPAERFVVRELDIGSVKTFFGFDGKPVTHAQFAKAYAVKVVPAVLFLGSDGRQLAAPIIGGDVAGMYGAYLDNALAEASKKLSADRQRIDEEKKR